MHFLQNEARKLNHQEVVEEDRRNKLPENFEAKKRRLEWEEEEDKRKKVIIILLVKFTILVSSTLSEMV